MTIGKGKVAITDEDMRLFFPSKNYPLLSTIIYSIILDGLPRTGIILEEGT